MMGLMNDKSKAAAAESTPKYEMKTINIINIIENPANSKIYSTENIEQLADSVELAGRVLQNLVVKPADENGKYMLISGHRRWMACKQLVSKGKLEFATVQCLIENEEDDQLQELMLIYTNSTARELNDAEKARQAERATAILTEMKKEKKLEGRVRDIVASMLKTTSGQLARYHAIMNNLKDGQLKEAFEKGELGVSVAYEASTLSEEGQKKIALQMQDGTVTLQNVTEVKMEERSDSPEWQERMKRIEQHREEDRRRAEAEDKGTTLDAGGEKIRRIHIEPEDGKEDAQPENGKEDRRKDLERQAMAAQVIIDFLRFKKEDQEKAAKTAEKLDNQEGAKNFREVAIQLQEMIADKEDEARFMKESIQRI